MTVEGSPDELFVPRPMEYSESNKQKTSQAECCSPSLKIFIGVLAFCYFSKSLTGAYTKSTITQIERRFEIPSSTVGIIDGSFEMGNLLVITVVSYFGAKFHRPKIIGAGVLLMGIGTLLMALPHFIMGRYKFDTAAAHTNDADNFTLISTCSSDTQTTVQQLVSGCQKGEEESSPTWVIVLLGNIIRGIGEASIGPLGMSFIDDYALPENSAFYIGCLHTLGVIGPIFGYTLGSLCASLYVDIGLVNQETITITPQDSRWVGAWWLGYVVSGLLTLLAALPLWFLPRALPENHQTSEQDHPSNQHKHTPSITEITKDFGPSLKHLLTNKIYLLYLVSNVVSFNAFAIFITYTPKYLEQQFGQSPTNTNFLIGLTSIPPVALGMFLSGWIMKRFKLDLLGSARMSFFTAISALFLTIPYFALSCENIDVAGVTVPYQGSVEVPNVNSDLLTSCNAGCGCSDFQWDPVCGQNGVTYISPCHAGCNSTRGTGWNMTFHNCTCVQCWELLCSAWTVFKREQLYYNVLYLSGTAVSRLLCVLYGHCSLLHHIIEVLFNFFTTYLAVINHNYSTVVCIHIRNLYEIFNMRICSCRIVDPELKSLSVGMLLLVLRVLGGIPAPIYFGALIDSTCVKWGHKKCGGRGACRMYDTETFRFLFLGLISCLQVLSYILLWVAITQITRKVQNDKQVSKDIELQEPILYPEK